MASHSQQFRHSRGSIDPSLRIARGSQPRGQIRQPVLQKSRRYGPLRRKLLGSASADEDKYLIFKFEYGDNTGGERDATAKSWTIAAQPGWVSSSGGAAQEVLLLQWAGTARPIERMDFHIRVTNPGASGSSVNVTRYVWSLNGVNMGEFNAHGGWATLGGVDSTDEAAMIEFQWDHEAQWDDREDVEWYFSMVKNPIQNNWAYDEVLRVHYRSDANGAQEVPSKNLAIVINMVSTASNPDTYRWKLADDEVWYGENSGAGSAFTDVPFQLADASSHITESAELQKYVFYFSGGADATGVAPSPSRSCDDSSVNSRYYIQLGSEGLNDFGYCSDRGVCDEDTGECKCFKGYAGQDCHEQHALSL